MQLLSRTILAMTLLAVLAGCNGRSDQDGKAGQGNGTTTKATTTTGATGSANRRPPTTAPATQPDSVIITIIAEQLGVERPLVTRKSDLAELGADDLARVEIAMELEDRFHLEIPDEDIDKMRTVGQIIDYINARLAQK